MPSYHNWHEVVTVLGALGYKQVSTQDERLIYENGEDVIVVQKENRLDVAYILTFCKQVGIKYMDFLKIYEKEYARSQKVATAPAANGTKADR